VPAAVASSLDRWPGLHWSASDLLARSGWRCELAADVRDEFLRFVAREPDVTAAGFIWDAKRLPRMAEFGASVRKELVEGAGLFWLRGLDALDSSPEHLRVLYVAFGLALGEEMLQYGRLYPVVDRGKSYKTEAVPVSMTNAETCFHTDSSSVDVVPDFVGLLCEQPSDRGGDSLVSNALRALQVLEQEHPEALAILETPKIRDVVTPGRERTQANLLRNRFPVFERTDRPGGVLFRYMRYWIEVGQDKAGQALDDRELRALDLLDEVLARPEHVVRFRLEQGDVLWVNNRVMAHNRTGYEDSPGNVRQLQRMWIQCATSQP
jgi:hypothetical protein